MHLPIKSPCLVQELPVRKKNDVLSLSRAICQKRLEGSGVGGGGEFEWAGAHWVVVRYISQLPRVFIRFFKALSGDRTLPLQKLFNY